ncbi:MAG: hypothetical protein PHH21_00420 [Candidatus Pacebacteria bacterium]|nr:hypothetical protein [Candidatus Paceibacterota bacterium]
MAAVLIIVSFFLLFAFEAAINDYAILLLSGLAGLVGMFFLCKSGVVDSETAVLSGLMFLGGTLTPLLFPTLRDYSLFFYAAVFVLMVLKPPDMPEATKAPVHH